MSPIPPPLISDLSAREVHRLLCATLGSLARAEQSSVLLFAEVFRRQIYRELGYATIQKYAREALGLSRSRTSMYLGLVRRFDDLPSLRRAVEKGEIGWTKARMIAKAATTSSEQHWIELARRRSRRDLARDIELARRHARGAPVPTLPLQVRGDGAAGQAQSASAPGPMRREGPPKEGVGRAAPGTPEARTGAAQAGPAAQLGPTAQAGSAAPARPAAPATPAAQAGALALPLTGDDRHDAVDGPLPAVFMDVTLRLEPEDSLRFRAVMEALLKTRRLPRSWGRAKIVVAALEKLLEAIVDAEGAEEAAEGDGHAAAGGNGGGSARGNGDDGAAGSGHGSGAGETGARVATDAAAKASPFGKCRPSRPGSFSRLNAAPLYQIVVFRDPRTGHGHVSGAHGEPRALPRPAMERIECDARVIDESGRQHSTVPPGVRRFVLGRDGYRCRVRGCVAVQFLEVHHLVPRSQGGGHEPENLVTVCSACHQFMHERPDLKIALRPLRAETPEDSKVGPPAETQAPAGD